MSVRLRLQRHGAKKKPFYRLVAADKRSPRDGRFIELLGTFDPMVEPPAVRINRDRVNYWLGVGAQPSETVAALIKKMDKAGSTSIDLSEAGAEEAARKQKRETKKKNVETRRAEATAAAAAVPAKAAAPVVEEAAPEAAAPEAAAEEAAPEEAAPEEAAPEAAAPVAEEAAPEAAAEEAAPAAEEDKGKEEA
ncbi:MAG: 30S ribosomal protein S16 [Bradymonadaceae bacterium]|nr:30S ribosomal protein S16 [Lujinxingiaceae bacterium]